MRTANLVTASLLGLLAAVVVADAVRLGIGWGSDGPKSGFFPFWLGVLMAVACAIIISQSLRQSPAQPFVTREQAEPVLKVLLPAVAMVIAMQWIGLYVAGALYIAVCMRWFGRHSWPAVVGCAVGVTVVTFLIFEKWFLVPMPKGPLETWLGY